MKKKRNRKHLVVQHLENVPQEAFKRFPTVMREFARWRNGVYALYKGNRLYYVGLARNLRSRLRTHLGDRHKGLWDRFSIYLTEGDEHLKELESLVLRIASPKGNRVRGKLVGSENLRRRFRKRIKECQKEELALFSGEPPEEDNGKSKETKEPTQKTGEPALASYASNKKFVIRLEHKDKRYVANVRQDGTIRFSAKGAGGPALRKVKFTSPSVAAKAVLGHAVNGWCCWRYRNKAGEWVILDRLRKKRK